MSKLQKMSETGECPRGGNAKGKMNREVLHKVFSKRPQPSKEAEM